MREATVVIVTRKNCLKLKFFYIMKGSERKHYKYITLKKIEKVKEKKEKKKSRIKNKRKEILLIPEIGKGSNLLYAVSRLKIQILNRISTSHI